MKFKLTNLLFSFFCSLFPLSHLFLRNYQHLFIDIIILPLLLIFIFNLLVYWLLYFISIFYNVNNYKIIIPLLSTFFFTYGLVHDKFYYGTIAGHTFIHYLSRNIILIPLYIILTAIFIYLFSKLKDIKFFSLFLIILNLLPLQYLFANNLVDRNNKSLKFNQEYIHTNNLNQNLPDVYFILTDMYPSDKVLKEHFDYNNSGFTTSLKKLGFIINENSYSTYSRTLLSLSSTLNLNYLHEIMPKVNLQYSEKQLIGVLQNNYVSSYFKSRGYQYYWFEGGYSEPSYHLNQNDHYISLQNSFDLTKNATTLNNDFNLMFINASFISLFSNKINIILTETYRKRVFSVINTLPLISKNTQSKFVFAYLAIPHPPIIFDEKGGSIYVEEIDTSFKTAYVGQLKYLNKLLLQTLIKIKNDNREKIIILQSDHGTRTLEPNNIFSFSQPWVKECLSNLNAIYISNKERKSLYPHPKTINTFRYILRDVFNENIDDLPVYSYYTDYKYPIKLYRITD